MCAEFLGLRQMCLLTFSQTLHTPDKYENKPTSWEDVLNLLVLWFGRVV